MIVSGSSKSKSVLLMDLLLTHAVFCNFKCKSSKVLYVNLEIDPASCINRFKTIMDAKGIDYKYADNIAIWNLRGHAIPMDKLVSKLIRRVKNQNYSAVIIDPIYKVITGDENKASDMGQFCNYFDRICSETGVSAIYCHHHSKGTQGQKKAQDRGSEAECLPHPDAIIDLIQI